MARLLVLAVLLVSGCQDERTPAQHIETARELARSGQLDAAIQEVNAAIELAPDDGALRRTQAELYIDAGRGDLAEVSIEQALRRGVEPMTLVVLKARSLVAQRAWERVLAEVVDDASLPSEGRVELLLARGQAQLAVTRGDDDLAAVRTFVQLFGLLDGAPDLSSRLASRLDALRTAPAVVRAQRHIECAHEATPVIGWQPRDDDAKQVLRVGPGRELATPAAAAAVANDGARIEIDAAKYPGGVAVWPQNGLHVVGVGGRPVVTANGKSVERRDVWLFKGNDVLVENVEISGARSVENKNGSAIRHIGRGLTLRYVYLHDSDNGLMTGNNEPESEILIEHTELARNGDGEGQAHNAYIGHSKALTFRYSYSHASRGGHLLKSRAATTKVEYSRLSDEEDGSGSYVIDVPNGGAVTVVGSVLEKGSGAVNHALISYGAEGLRYADNRLNVANDSVYNRDPRGIAIRNHTPVVVRIFNVVFAGAPVIQIDGAGDATSNVTRPDNGLEEPREFAFEPGPDSIVVDAGIDANDPDAVPRFEYVHPVQYRVRREVARIDIGAYERCGL